MLGRDLEAEPMQHAGGERGAGRGGVHITVLGGAMRSIMLQISSLDSSSSGTKSTARSASRTASSTVAASRTERPRPAKTASARRSFSGMTSSSTTTKPARAQAAANSRPCTPAPMTAMTRFSATGYFTEMEFRTVS